MVVHPSSSKLSINLKKDCRFSEKHLFLCGNKGNFIVIAEMRDENLCRDIERVVGRTMITSSDFVWLSGQIAARQRSSVSVNTLKRQWGYLEKDDTSVRRSTLDILSQFIGFRDYSTYCRQCQSLDPQSNPVLSRHIDTRRLERGLRLRITWLPDREVVIEHLGSCQFIVRSVKNSKLAVDDTFECMLFMENEPLYLGNLVHLGAGPVAYVAGKRDGIRFEIIED